MKNLSFYLSGIAFVAIAGIILTVASCKKTESVVTPRLPGNEFLTTVVFQCINKAAPFDTTTAIWRQVDPSGAAAPDTSKALLVYKKNSVYTCNIYILDESKTASASYASNTPYNFNINRLASTTVNVTPEIRARQNYHLECFFMTGGVPFLGSNLTVVRTDYDNNTPALQVGLNDNVTTSSNSIPANTNGRMEIIQEHQPNVKNGTCGPGSIDFDIFLGVSIQ
jgi:hypothetical protein